MLDIPNNYHETGWRRPRQAPSLSEVYRSVPMHTGTSVWRRMLAFAGPGYLVAVGYMDPGNWATSLAAGSAYGFSLLAVILLSNFIAIFLQALALRLGIVTGRDLAQACRDHFGKTISIGLWFICEIAICATDLAEVIGTAIALNLLFKIPLTIGILITALDVILLLSLQRFGFRKLEALIISLLGLIALCFAYTIIMAQPEWGAVLAGYFPSAQLVTDPNMLYLAIGILGATVMPHNLYLHSAVVQTRQYVEDDKGKREAIRFATIDSTVALTFALLINSAILILAASVFNAHGYHKVAEIQDAYHLLTPILGTGLAAVAFGVALLACGLNSTVTATLAGQIVMEGFIHIRLAPWLRRMITRLLAIIPAALVAYYYGESGTAKLLIFSQVILSLQLPFAIIPLMMFVADKRKMQQFTIPLWAQILGYAIAVLIIGLNLFLLYNLAQSSS